MACRTHFKINAIDKVGIDQYSKKKIKIFSQVESLQFSSNSEFLSVIAIFMLSMTFAWEAKVL